MNKISKVITRLLLACTISTAHAACRDDISASTPSRDFMVHDNGTVTHNTTGLMWMRCSLGQSWDGNTCTGSASSFTWVEALIAGKYYTLAGFSDWRLPNKNELSSLVEQRCANPAINSSLFPNTPGNLFWSSSPFARNSNGAWVVSFGDGLVDHSGSPFGKGKENLYRVRLVRAGQ